MQLNTKPTKKMMLPLILEVLKEHSDSEHTLSQKNIRDILQDQYMMSADRKSIRRNIDCLIEMGYPIEYTTTTRMKTNPETGEREEEELVSELWLENDFEDSELRLVIDAILFSGHIPEKQKNDLIDKLANLSSKHFKSHIRHIKSLSPGLPQNPQLFLNIEILDEAIAEKKKIKYYLVEYEEDKKLHAVSARQYRLARNKGEKPHPEFGNFGPARVYTASPYQMVAKNGNYYLVYCPAGEDETRHVRIDRMSDIVILDEDRLPYSETKDAKGPTLDLERYVCEHPLMDDKPLRMNIQDIILEVHVRALSDVLDAFGKDVRISEGQKGYLRQVKFRASAADVLNFAYLHYQDVAIEKPRVLAQILTNRASAILNKYGTEFNILPAMFYGNLTNKETRSYLRSLIKQNRQDAAKNEEAKEDFRNKK